MKLSLVNAMSLSKEDLETLGEAKQVLESPGLAIKLTDLIGKPIEKGFDLLPDNWSERISMATQGALEQALGVAVKSLGESKRSSPSDFRHKLAVMASGAVGGAFGFAGLAVELPVSTTIMLRSIGAIAQSEGENLKEADSKLECIRVLPLAAGLRTTMPQSRLTLLCEWPWPRPYRKRPSTWPRTVSGEKSLPSWSS